jgi:hypothetical protein
LSLSHPHRVRTGRKVQRAYLPGPESEDGPEGAEGIPSGPRERCYQQRSMSGGRRRVLVTVAPPQSEDGPEGAQGIPSGPRE